MSVKLPFKANDKTIRKAVNLYQTDKLIAIQTYGKMDTWNTERVTDMSHLFSNAYNTGTKFDNINDIISGWNVSKVTNMKKMFNFCKTFNQPLDSWVLSTDPNVAINMNMMFYFCETFNQDLNNWNVSRVTNMNSMFLECKAFNQPLDHWVTSRVTNMGSMFLQCESFNQPLDHWVTSNVTNMNRMFSGCLSFNQNISNWTINPTINVIHGYSRVFENCPITEANKPHVIIPVVIAPVVIAPAVVNARQIHQAASKIDYSKLNEFLSTKIPLPIVTPQNYANYIKDIINLIINTISETREKKTELKDDLLKIYNERLKGLDYTKQSPLTRDSIIYSLEYVKQQPQDFKQMYVETFVKDCVHAYEGTYGMTCAAGALERIVLSLVPACNTVETNPDYKTIIIIISGPELIKQSIKDWYILHNSTNTDNDIFHTKTKTEKQADLREYLLGLYPNETKIIDDLIINYAEGLGYEASDFTFEGGKRRNSRKRRKRINKQKNKTRKRQKNKSRKQYKKRT